MTTVYLLNMIINSEIPEIIPLEGLRVKLQYQRVKKLCTICFGKHLRKDCDGTKVTWPEYIKVFKEKNLSITEDFYVDNIRRFDSAKKQKSMRQEPFVRPRNGAEWTTLIKRVRDSGGPNRDDTLFIIKVLVT